MTHLLPCHVPLSRSLLSSVYTLGYALPAIVYIKRTPSLRGSFVTKALAAVAVYIAVYPNLWLASSAIIGLAYGVVSSQHKSFYSLSLPGVLIALVTYLFWLYFMVTGFAELSDRPDEEGMENDPGSNFYFIMDPIWIFASNQYIGTVLGTWILFQSPSLLLILLCRP